jgi:hypothetical protein
MTKFEREINLCGNDIHYVPGVPNPYSKRGLLDGRWSIELFNTFIHSLDVFPKKFPFNTNPIKIIRQGSKLIIRESQI